MAQGFLNPGQKEQAVNMAKDGKTTDEILSFFKANYNLDVPRPVIYNIKYRLPKPAGSPTSSKIAKRSYNRKQPQAVLAPSDDNIKNLVDQLRAELEAYSNFVIKKIRTELVKAIAEARKKRIDVGEDVEEYTAPEIGE